MQKNSKILYAENDQETAFIYREILEYYGFLVKITNDGNKVWDLLQNESWDLLLLDINLPGKDGHELIRLVKNSNNPIPIIIFSSLNHINTLYEGADDYLIKGCSNNEIKARIDKAIARTQEINQKKEYNLFRISPLVIFNKNSRQLIIEGKTEELKGMESRILGLFCLRINKTIPFKEMCENLWGVHSVEKEKSLIRYVCLLNKKLKQNSTVHIQNDFGIGYKLVSE